MDADVSGTAKVKWMSPERADLDGRTSALAQVRAAERTPSQVSGDTSEVLAPVSAGSRPYLASNASVMFALQRSAGNAAIGRVLKQTAAVQRANQLTVQRDRDELLKAFQDEVAAGKWADAAVRLNGFNDPDINARLKELNYDQRAKLLDACPDWNSRVRTPALDLNYQADLASGDLKHASILLNGFNDADIASRLAKIPPDRLIDMLVVAPDWNTRVLDAGMKLQPKEKHREWPVDKFITVWGKLHGQTMTPQQMGVLSFGCIGITRLNLDDDRPNPPLGLAFGTLAQARDVASALNQIIATRPTMDQYTDMMMAHPTLGKLKNLNTAIPVTGDPKDWMAVVFSKRFYSNQNPDWNKAKRPDKKGFKPDPKTGQVDMSSYDYKGRPDPSEGKDARMIGFDYGWYDEASNTWWHANHGEPGMVVYESTLDYYSRPLLNFDREVFIVALAKKH